MALLLNPSSKKLHSKRVAKNYFPVKGIMLQDIMLQDIIIDKMISSCPNSAV
jgi:hypothetical protein